jgi:1-acyl-sn-glycerol-3-phosphate acyltransferase
MLRKLFRLLFYLKGWTTKCEEFNKHEKCVVIAAPHTSNWDLVFMIAAFDLMKLPLRFTIKKEWLRFPFRGLLNSIGAVSIDRSPKVEGQERPSMVDEMAKLFQREQRFALAVSVEGTRKKVEHWKTGFYYIAEKAGVPILLGYLDYQKKEAGVARVLYPSGNFEKDMSEIMEFYAQIVPCYPEKFSIDIRYGKQKKES